MSSSLPDSPAKATFYVQLTEGVNYVRADLPARYLPGRVVRDVAVSFGDDRSDVFTLDQEGQAAVWMFPGNSVRGVVMANQVRQGLRVLVEVDDNYTIGPPIDSGAWMRDAVDFHNHSYPMHKLIVPHAHGVIVSTPELAKVYREMNRHVFVCENCVDPGDWPANPDHQRDDVLRVGWAASDSHTLDAALIEPALRWASEQPGVEAVVFGIKTWRPRFKHRYVPFRDLASYRASLHELIDVMLCPLQPSPWTACKSDLKAMEAAVSGACSVVSGTAPYRNWRDGPALTAFDAGDFKRQVQRLVRNRNLVRELAEAAREYVLSERTIQGNVWRWEEACSWASDTAEMAVAA